MLLKTIIFTTFILINHIQCGLLIWGTHNIQIPSLKQFNNIDLDLLIEDFKNPKIVVFRGDPTSITDDFKDLLKNKYTAYIPNTDLSLDNIIELDGDSFENYEIIKQTLDESVANYGNNILALLISTNKRLRREIDEATEEPDKEDEEVQEIIELPKEYQGEPTGPILYNADGKAMLYTSKPPILSTNRSTLILGKSTFTVFDKRGANFSRLSVTIPVIDGKVTLRFKFPWNSGYWTLSSVELVDTESKTYNLFIKQHVEASRNFSYHCPGHTVFVDEENEIELKLFDIQVQPDTKTDRFDDAYDCVTFTTVPIWSGIFVTSILLIVLGIGLCALNSIKTMDKFDNYKTKQLTISVNE